MARNHGHFPGPSDCGGHRSRARGCVLLPVVEEDPLRGEQHGDLVPRRHPHAHAASRAADAHSDDQRVVFARGAHPRPRIPGYRGCWRGRFEYQTGPAACRPVGGAACASPRARFGCDRRGRGSRRPHRCLGPRGDDKDTAGGPGAPRFQGRLRHAPGVHAGEHRQRGRPVLRRLPDRFERIPHWSCRCHVDHELPGHPGGRVQPSGGCVGTFRSGVRLVAT